MLLLPFLQSFPLSAIFGPVSVLKEINFKTFSEVLRTHLLSVAILWAALPALAMILPLCPGITRVVPGTATFFLFPFQPLRPCRTVEKHENSFGTFRIFFRPNVLVDPSTVVAVFIVLFVVVSL